MRTLRERAEADAAALQQRVHELEDQNERYRLSLGEMEESCQMLRRDLTGMNSRSYVVFRI
jgi:hypothetical protein